MNRIGNVALWITDLERSERFYVDGLGLEVTARVETAEVQEVIVGQPGSTELMLAVRRDGGHRVAPDGIWKVFVFTDDLDTSYQRALDAGGAAEAPPTLLTEFPISIALVRDPDGHLVELGQLHDLPAS